MTYLFINLIALAHYHLGNYEEALALDALGESEANDIVRAMIEKAPVCINYPPGGVVALL